DGRAIERRQAGQRAHTVAGRDGSGSVPARAGESGLTPAQFAERTVLVTGAAGNLGRAVASAFAQAGANLVLLDVKRGPLEDRAKQLFIATDLFDPRSAHAAVAHAGQRFKRI